MSCLCLIRLRQKRTKTEESFLHWIFFYHNSPQRRRSTNGNTTDFSASEWKFADMWRCCVPLKESEHETRTTWEQVPDLKPSVRNSHSQTLLLSFSFHLAEKKTPMDTPTNRHQWSPTNKSQSTNTNWLQLTKTYSNQTLPTRWLQKNNDNQLTQTDTKGREWTPTNQHQTRIGVHMWKQTQMDANWHRPTNANQPTPTDTRWSKLTQPKYCQQDKWQQNNDNQLTQMDMKGHQLTPNNWHHLMDANKCENGHKRTPWTLTNRCQSTNINQGQFMPTYANKTLTTNWHRWTPMNANGHQPMGTNQLTPTDANWHKLNTDISQRQPTCTCRHRTESFSALLFLYHNPAVTPTNLLLSDWPVLWRPFRDGALHRPWCLWTLVWWFLSVMTSVTDSDGPVFVSEISFLNVCVCGFCF